jgi:hypothetical protein
MANLAETLRQVGYVTPQGQVTGPNAPLAQQLKNYVTNVIPTAAQNLAQQRADIDAAITMGQNGIQIGDREAFERQMAQVPNMVGMIKDVSGKPLTVYHGTKSTIDEFIPSKGGEYGSGIYFADEPSMAAFFARNAKGESGENIIPANLNIKNPLNVTAYDRDKVRGYSIKQLMKKGYDGIVATGLTGQKQYIAFQPEQVISTITKKPITRKEILEQELKKVVE